MKFRSLMFRELKLSRKSVLLQFVLLLIMTAMTWLMLFSASTESPENMPMTINAVVLATALLSIMSLLLDEIFKSDINSGWLNYSYALPISPIQRAAVHFIRKFSVCFLSILLSLCNAEAISIFWNMGLSVNYVVWHIIVLIAGLIFSLTNDIFILQARSSADMKKMQTASGLVNVIIMVVSIVIIWKTSGINFEQISNGEGAIALPEFTAGALALAVPLLMLLVLVDFFAIYLNLKSAYFHALKSVNNNENNVSKAVILQKTDGATGLLFKELKQNKLIIILAAVTPILLTVFPVFFTIFGVLAGNTEIDEVFEVLTNDIIRLLMWLIGLFVVSGLMSEVFKGDDKKLWAYFIVSTPQGVKGFIYRKYVIMLLLSIIYMASGTFAETMLATVTYFGTGEEITFNMLTMYAAGVFMLMLIGAFDIPLTVRFGSKKGIITVIATAPLMAINTIGEEFGWRGYMNQKLELLFGTTGTVIIGGIIWGLWHAELTVAGHNFGTDYPGYPYMGIIYMCISCTFLGIILMWLTKKTNSIYPTAIMHAMNNYGGATTMQFFLSGIPEGYEVNVPEIMLLDIPMNVAAIVVFVILIRDSKKANKPALS